MKRRSFLSAALWAPLAVLGGLTALVQGCSDDDGVVSGTTPACDGKSATTIDQHFHPNCITQAQLDARAPITIILQPGGHTHTLSLTATEVGNIADGITVLATSSSDSAHRHEVTFN